jgi:hypothetical protein
MTIGIFDLEVKEKKREASLNRSRTGSRGGSKSRKGMNTPYDYLTTKEKRKLNGEVSVFNMNETILTKEEFDLKDESLKKTLLLRWRELYDNKKIMTEMGMTNARYYKMVNELGLTTSRGGSKPRKARMNKPQENKPTLLESALEIAVEPMEETKPEVKPILISRGLHLEYNGDYTAEELNKIFMKLQLITEGEENKFTLSINLTERA